MTVLNAESAEPTFTGQVVLGRYHVVLPLGRGGQGLVHLARAEGAAGVARPVVIKRVLAPLAQDKPTRERFILEARITARLRHPDIVSIVEFELESDDSYLMVLEYVHGYDLWRWARFVQAQRGGLAPRLVAYIGTRVLDALHYSHSLRDPDGTPTPVIHRDVSAGNVLIDVTGQVKLTDFGIAWVAREGSVADGAHGIYGKLGYIAPELFLGAAPSPASDVYACGVMLHGLLLGTNEFQAADLAAAQVRALAHVPTRIDAVRQDIGRTAADVIARALEKEPAARFESAASFSAELRRAFRLDLAEVREEFAAVVEQDFENPVFARLMNVLSLRDVDAAWRRQDADAPSHSLRPTQRPPRPAPAPVVDDLLHADNDNASDLRDEAAEPVLRADHTRRLRFETLGWSLAVALLVALVFTMIGMQARVSTESRVLYVEAQPASQPSAEPPTPPEGQAAPVVSPEPMRSAAAVESEPASELANAKRSEEPLATSGVQLTARFARQRAQVSRCFRDHQGKQTSGRVSVAFEVDPRGRVQKAELEPAELADSKLGRCLLAVSTATRFGRQSGYLRFRIPISAQTTHEKP